MLCLCFVLLLALITHLLGMDKDGFNSCAFEGDIVEIDGKAERVEYDGDSQILYMKQLSVPSEYLATEFGKELTANCEKGCIAYLSEKADIRVGSYVRVRGRVTPFGEKRNPGGFSYKFYRYVRGYSFSLRRCEVTGMSREYDALADYLQSLRRKAEEALDSFLSENDCGVIKAMLLGDKKELSDEDSFLFKTGGISHILAISGLHISLIGMGLYKLISLLLKPFEMFLIRRRLSRYPLLFVKVTFPVLFMIMFGIMTGMSSSACRAISMFAVSLNAARIGRTYDPLTALSFSAFLLALSEPLYIFDRGYLLSFGAVIGISGLVPVFRHFGGYSPAASYPSGENVYHYRRKMLYVFFGNLLRRIRDICYVTLSVSLITYPILIGSYYEYSLYSVPVNLIIVPSVTCLAAAALFLCIFGMAALGTGFASDVSSLISELLSFVCRLMLEGYRAVLEFVETLPFSNIVTGKPSLIQTVIYYVGIGALILICVRKQKEKTKEKGAGKRILFILYISCLIFTLSVSFEKDFSVTMLDVGQGDSLFIRENGSVFMIDGGSSSEKETAKYTIIPFLKEEGVSHVDKWFVSHPDTDHVNGLVQLLQSDTGVTIGEIVLPKYDNVKEDACEILRLSEEKKIPVRFIEKGFKMTDGDMKLTCLHPGNGQYDDINDCSEVLYIEYGDFSMLFTGDAGINAEKEYISYAGEIGIDISETDVLKVAHHGSENATGEMLLNALRPQAALISAGKNNKYHHPGKETINRLNNAKVPYLCTIEKGAITLYPKDSGIVIEYMAGE